MTILFFATNLSNKIILMATITGSSTWYKMRNYLKCNFHSASFLYLHTNQILVGKEVTLYDVIPSFVQPVIRKRKSTKVLNVHVTKVNFDLIIVPIIITIARHELECSLLGKLIQLLLISRYTCWRTWSPFNISFWTVRRSKKKTIAQIT